MNVTLRRLGWARVAMENPIVFFYLFRLITWALAVLLLVTEAAPDVNRRYAEGLALYVLFHLALGTLYAAAIHPRLRRSGERQTQLDLLTIGLMDIVASIIVVYYSGGWGSPFWHFAVTSLLIPCFLVGYRWAFLVTTLYVGLYVLAVMRGGDGMSGVWTGIERHLFIGFVFTAYLVGLAVTYLGHLFRELDTERRRAHRALSNLETLYEVTQNVRVEQTEARHLTHQVSQTLRGRGEFDSFAIYLYEPATGMLVLDSSTVGVEELIDPPGLRLGEGLTGRAGETGLAQTAHGESSGWTAALPLKTGDALIGVAVFHVDGSVPEPDSLLELCQALANQIAIGIHATRLHARQLELVAEEERNRIARDIHDGVAQSMYALSLSLEACVEAAARANSPLTERLERLVPLARNTLLETRHYIYDLKPLLSGETDIAAVAENQVREFKMVSGVPTTLALEGDPPAVDIPTTTTFYRVLQEALSNVLKHAHASNVSVRLLFSPQSVTLCVEDDGRGFDIDNAPSGYGLDNIRSRVAEMRGTVEVSSAPNRGTRLTVVLPAKGAVA